MTGEAAVQVAVVVLLVMWIGWALLGPRPPKPPTVVVLPPRL